MKPTSEIVYGEHGEREARSLGPGSGELLLTIMHRTGLPPAQALEVIELVEDTLPSFGGNTDFAAYRDLVDRGFLHLRVCVRRGADPNLYERCLWLMLKHESLAGARNLTELSKKIKCSKQTVNKCLRDFQRTIPELPNIPGQRAREARAAMAAAANKRAARGGRNSKSQQPENNP